MPNKNGGEPAAEGEPLTETQPRFEGAFEGVYRFIVQAVKGDKATADAVFEDYLAGKSEELLSISRACVSADQASSSNRNLGEWWCRERGALEVK